MSIWSDTGPNCSNALPVLVPEEKFSAVISAPPRAPPFGHAVPDGKTADIVADDPFIIVVILPYPSFSRVQFIAPAASFHVVSTLLVDDVTPLAPIACTANSPGDGEEKSKPSVMLPDKARKS